MQNQIERNGVRMLRESEVNKKYVYEIMYGFNKVYKQDKENQQRVCNVLASNQQGRPSIHLG